MIITCARGPIVGATRIIRGRIEGAERQWEWRRKYNAMQIQAHHLVDQEWSALIR